MIYVDLEKIYKSRGIENKYALAMIVSTRARQLSEQKGRMLDGEGSERYITYALNEVQDGDLILKGPLAPAHAQSAQPEAADVPAATPNATVDA